MQTAFLGRSGDSLLLCLAKRIHELDRDASPPVLSLDLDVPISLDPRAVTWDGHEMSAFDSLWVSGFTYLDPVVPDEGGGTDWTVWDARYVARQQRYSALHSLLKELDRRGVSVINPPHAYLDDWIKGHQLARLRDSGFAVPRFMCTNDMDFAEAFGRDVGDVCWRPVTGRGAWQKFGDKQREHLIAGDRAPVLLAQASPGPFKRVWILDGEPLLALDCLPPAFQPVEDRARREFGEVADLGDLYGDRLYLEALETFDPFEASVHGDLWSRLGAHLGLRWFMAICAESAGVLRLYDIDPDPALDWLPAVYQAWLLEGIASRLSGVRHPAASTAAAAGGPGVSAERPALFLRRMLQILFEMEESKYIDEQPDARDIEP